MSEKCIIYQNVQHENRHPILIAYCLFAIFRILIFQKKKRYAQISVFLIFIKSGQTMVKLLIQEVLVLLNNYSRILVLLNNYFTFFEFWSIWSNYGQTVVKRWSNYLFKNISVTK